MSDIFYDEPSRAEFIDPFWLRQSQAILRIREAIGFPKTKIGEKITVNNQGTLIFLTYNRLSDIFASLVCLMEYDEIFTFLNDGFFHNPLNQRVLVRAFSLAVEDAVKFPVKPGEARVYGDYQPFLNGIFRTLKSYDFQVEKGTVYPNIVNSLVMAFSQSANELPGVSSFQVMNDNIREQIRGYIPVYAGINSGQLLRAQVEAIRFPSRK